MLTPAHTVLTARLRILRGYEEESGCESPGDTIAKEINGAEQPRVTSNAAHLTLEERAKGSRWRTGHIREPHAGNEGNHLTTDFTTFTKFNLRVDHGSKHRTLKPRRVQMVLDSVVTFKSF